MKKIILSILILLVVTAVWLKKTTQHVTVLVSEDKVLSTSTIASPTSDYQKIVKHLRPENVDNREWELVNDYSLKPSDVVNHKNAESFFRITKANIPEIYSCLKKDFCGMTSRGPDDAYFDDTKTPAHILLNRSLKIMRASLKRNQALKTQVDWDILQELAESEVEMLSIEALDIIREFNSEGIKTDELIGVTENFKGTVKAQALLRLSKTNKKLDKALIANEVENVFLKGDADTVISVLEQLKVMALTADQSVKVLTGLCRFKDMDDEIKNWAMIKYEAKKINSDFEKNCNE